MATIVTFVIYRKVYITAPTVSEKYTDLICQLLLRSLDVADGCDYAQNLLFEIVLNADFQIAVFQNIDLSIKKYYTAIARKRFH